jgi:hypothetical protein
MGIAFLFFIFFVWLCFMNQKHEALSPLKNYKLYIVCTLILSNHFHLTIGSQLILIQSEL